MRLGRLLWFLTFVGKIAAADGSLAQEKDGIDSRPASVALSQESATTGSASKSGSVKTEDRDQTIQQKRTTLGISDDIFRNAVALLNLLFVIFAFSISQSNRSRDQALNDSQEKRSIEAFWYQKIVIEPNLPKIVDFFSFCRTHVAGYKQSASLLALNGGQIAALQKLLEDANHALSARKRDLVANLIHGLYIVDRNLADICVNILDGVQDEISNSLDQVSVDTSAEALNAKLDQLKVDLMKKLYASHLKACGPQV